MEQTVTPFTEKEGKDEWGNVWIRRKAFEGRTQENLIMVEKVIENASVTLSSRRNEGVKEREK